LARSKGFRRRTRKLLRKSPRNRGLQPLGGLLREYKLGDKVLVKINPSVHKGMPHRRYHGRIGRIVEKRGNAYVVTINDGGKDKTIITRPEHIKPYED
jgi:large subunit ribosomal protein L21e